MPYGCFPLAAFLGRLILLPLFLADIMLTALARLGLSPMASMWAALGIFLGGMINIPIRQIPRTEVLESPAFGMFGFERMFPQRVRRTPYTVIAVNLGGCVVPVMIVAYELIRISIYSLADLFLTLLAVAINVAACYHKEIQSINTSVASIGGAGTFDGIVISGLLATLLAY